MTSQLLPGQALLQVRENNYRAMAKTRCMANSCIQPHRSNTPSNSMRLLLSHLRQTRLNSMLPRRHRLPQANRTSMPLRRHLLQQTRPSSTLRLPSKPSPAMLSTIPDRLNIRPLRDHTNRPQFTIRRLPLQRRLSSRHPPPR